jgi:hypothetical protein
MDLGAAITASAAIFGIVAVIYKLVPSKNPNDHCPEHSGVCENLTTLESWLNKIEGKLDRVIEQRRLP